MEAATPEPGHSRHEAAGPSGEATSAKTLREQVDDFKRLQVSRAVAAHDGNWAAAARSLGMARGNLHHMARRLGLLD